MAKAKTKNVKDRPLGRFRSNVVRDAPAQVDPSGGRYGVGLIRGASAITAGEALGHGMWIDKSFLSHVNSEINGASVIDGSGVKMRFTHPDVSSDGTGKYLGRAVGSTIQGDSVIIDEIHFSKSATKSPDGNLADYVTTLAAESPESFGLSISFLHDPAAEDIHYNQNSIDGEFKSPDPANVKNLPHVRLGQLLAVDVVDDPAANPRGLFHREHALASEASTLAKFVLGLEDTAPATVSLGIDAGRARAFVSRFMAEHNLEVKEVSGMADDITKPDDESEDVKASETPAAEEATKEEDKAPQEEPQVSNQSAGRKFLEAFGDQGGVWFAMGKTFEECQVEYCKLLRADVEKLKSENAELTKRLSAGRRVFASVDEGSRFQSGDERKKRSLSEAVRIVGRG